MQFSEAFRALGEDQFRQLLRHIAIGKLKTFQLYDAFKVRAHLTKLNTEALRKAAPRLWQRITEGDEELARELAQGVLVSNVPMLQAVLDFLGIPNNEGFFEKDLDGSRYLTEGWQQRVYEKFRAAFPEPVLLLYINHLAFELDKSAELFAPVTQA